MSSGSPQSRYDILFAFPGETITLNSLQEDDFLQQLDRHWSSWKHESKDSTSEMPFRGGWFLFMAYELVGQIEPRLSPLMLQPDVPIARAVRMPAAIVCDRQQQQCWLLAEQGAEALIDEMRVDCQQNARISSRTKLLKSVEEDPALDFESAVRKTLEYCYEGDIFQANLSRAWRGELQPQAGYLDVYQCLRDFNPAPFAGLARLGDTVICSSSPERLVRVHGNRVDMRPIAGTRPRGAEQSSDLAHSTELLQHPKERAEHLMLLDLIRNDLGRVCDYGSVHVDEAMILESYATVHHIVSNVCGNKRDSVTPGDIIRAVFPGGTITGCPKVRCMEIIAELETSPRGPYTGSMGYLNHDGDMDLNILIRTIEVNGQRFRFRSGAGIVADSQPQAELLETRHKAEGMLRALEG